MKKCCFIIPYFGNFPNYFPLFLKSCSYNKDFNWLVITDNNSHYNYPENFSVIKMSFGELRALIQSKFDFSIKLDNPYKLCDYKPAYGYLFEDHIKDFQYWGHCDVDTIMGNLSRFLTPLFNEGYNKIFCLGHMTIYQNSFENNRIFMSEFKEKKLYKNVFSSSKICWFDEEWKDEYNINGIFLSKNKKVYLRDFSYNIYIPKTKFYRTVYVGKNTENYGHGYRLEPYKKSLFIWDTSGLYRFHIDNKELVKNEYMYMHFQKRKMSYNKSLESKNIEIFKIIPNAFLPLEVSNITIDNFKKIKRISPNLHYWNIHLKPKIKNVFKIIKVQHI